MISEFKHTGRWSVSLTSLPVCLHKLQIGKGWSRDSGRSASPWGPAILVSVIVGH